MVNYGKIFSKLWQSIPSLGSSAQTLSKETTSYLEYQAETWAQSIPKELQLESSHISYCDVDMDKRMHRLRVLLHLRKNHLALLINHHSVLSTESVQNDPGTVQSLIETAKDTISVLVHLKNTGSMYTRRQATFNHFLMTALAIIL